MSDSARLLLRFLHFLMIADTTSKTTGKETPKVNIIDLGLLPPDDPIYSSGCVMISPLKSRRSMLTLPEDMDGTDQPEMEDRDQDKPDLEGQEHPR